MGVGIPKKVDFSVKVQHRLTSRNLFRVGRIAGFNRFLIGRVKLLGLITATDVERRI